MLSSVDLPTATGDLRAEGISECLVKPVTRDTLLKAILKVLGERTQPPARTGEPDSAASQRPMRVLLAEDNLVNQRVAMALLAKAGHQVVAVATGEAALDAYSRDRFDLVLMDVQMPVMNGFDATRAIRAREQRSGARRTPIIALTAHAMSGDQEMCLDAGMDDYLSKPVHLRALHKALQHWGTGCEAPLMSR